MRNVKKYKYRKSLKITDATWEILKQMYNDKLDKMTPRYKTKPLF